MVLFFNFNCDGATGSVWETSFRTEDIYGGFVNEFVGDCIDKANLTRKVRDSFSRIGAGSNSLNFEARIISFETP